jgi:hypothetical protein
LTSRLVTLTPTALAGKTTRSKVLPANPLLLANVVVSDAAWADVAAASDDAHAIAAATPTAAPLSRRLLVGP